MIRGQVLDYELFYFQACVDGNLAGIEKSLEHVNIDCKDKHNGETGLIIAARLGHDKTVKMLIECGSNPDAKNNNGYTALTSSVLHTKIDIATLLINAGANLDIQDNVGDTALMASFFLKK